MDLQRRVILHQERQTGVRDLEARRRFNQTLRAGASIVFDAGRGDAAVLCASLDTVDDMQRQVDDMFESFHDDRFQQVFRIEQPEHMYGFKVQGREVQLTEEIGRGGFGQLFKAEWEGEEDVKLAIKMIQLPKRFVEREPVLEMALREAIVQVRLHCMLRLGDPLQTKLLREHRANAQLAALDPRKRVQARRAKNLLWLTDRMRKAARIPPVSFVQGVSIVPAFALSSLSQNRRLYIGMPRLDSTVDSLLEEMNDQGDKEEIGRLLSRVLEAVALTLLRLQRAARFMHNDLKLNNVMVGGAYQPSVQIIDFGGASLDVPNPTVPSRWLVASPDGEGGEEMAEEALLGADSPFRAGKDLLTAIMYVTRTVRSEYLPEFVHKLLNPLGDAIAERHDELAGSEDEPPEWFYRWDGLDHGNDSWRMCYENDFLEYFSEHVERFAPFNVLRAINPRFSVLAPWLAPTKE